MFGFGRKKKELPPATQPPTASLLPSDRRTKPRLVTVQGATAPPPPSQVAQRQPPVNAPRQLIGYKEVPASQGLLTLGPRAVMKVPEEFKYDILAIELGTKRCAILFNPACLNQAGQKAHILSLRNKLIAAQYNFDPGGDYPCKPDVIKLILDDYLAKNGDTEARNGGQVQSQAKDRFLRWQEIAVEQGATDLHISVTGPGRAIVQIRVDGELENLRDARGGAYTELEATESMAWPFNSGSMRGSNSVSSWNNSINLSCMTDPIPVGGKMIALRYQSLKGYLGPKVICRLLNVDVNAPTLTYDQLGFARSQSATMIDAAAMASGFILLAGVTGSGKTTLLKTLVETHPGNGSMAMYAIEDPVEYPLRGVHQIVLQLDISKPEESIRQYNETVTALMRADPDLVIVGEMRNRAAASAGQQIVETGHTAAGTVHAHLLTGIIPRLTNSEIGMSRDVLTNPNMLSLLSYQALVPKLCPKCKHSGPTAIEAAKQYDALHPGVSNEARRITELLTNVETRFQLDTSNLRFRNTEGCPHCNRRGTMGVTVVAEMTIPTRQWLELTRAGKDYEAMVHYRQSSDGHFHTEDMTGKTVFEHTLLKSLTGGVDPRHCNRFGSFKRFELHPTLGNSDFK